MRPHNLILATCVSVATLYQSAIAQEVRAAPEIQGSVKVLRAAPKDLGTKRLLVTAPNSERLSTILAEDLRAKGYSVVAAGASPDIQMRCQAKFNISGAGKETASGDVEQLLRPAETTQLAPSTSDLKHQNVSLDQIAAVSVGFGVLPIADIFIWLSQKSGLAGAINKAITGDPRGFCLHDNCSKFTQRVVVGCTGDVAWVLTYQAVSERIVIDQVIEVALKDMRDQFPALSGEVTKAIPKESD